MLDSVSLLWYIFFCLVLFPSFPPPIAFLTHWQTIVTSLMCILLFVWILIKNYLALLCSCIFNFSTWYSALDLFLSLLSVYLFKIFFHAALGFEDPSIGWRDFWSIIANACTVLHSGILHISSGSRHLGGLEVSTLHWASCPHPLVNRCGIVWGLWDQRARVC